MKKSEIIETTLAAMRRPGGLLDSSQDSQDDNDEYEKSVVMPTLLERLPDGVEIKTCSDFADLAVTCCERCHTLYAFYEMYLEDLPGEDKAWICCAISRALRGESVETDVAALDQLIRGDAPNLDQSDANHEND